jgi:hypothetical protein
MPLNGNGHQAIEAPATFLNRQPLIVNPISKIQNQQSEEVRQ